VLRRICRLLTQRYGPRSPPGAQRETADSRRIATHEALPATRPQPNVGIQTSSGSDAQGSVARIGRTERFVPPALCPSSPPPEPESPPTSEGVGSACGGSGRLSRELWRGSKAVTAERPSEAQRPPVQDGPGRAVPGEAIRVPHDQEPAPARCSRHDAQRPRPHREPNTERHNLPDRGERSRERRSESHTDHPNLTGPGSPAPLTPTPPASATPTRRHPPASAPPGQPRGQTPSPAHRREPPASAPRR